MGCVVAMLFAAVGASSAFAEFTEGETCGTTGIPTVCITKTEGGVLKEAKGEEKGLITETEEAAKLSVPSLELELSSPAVDCEAPCQVDQLEPLVKVPTLLAKLVFLEVTVVGALAAKCKVVSPITTKSLVGTALNEKEIEFKPESGEIFTEVEIGNQTGQTCPATVKGINPVKGTDVCEVLNNNVNQKSHLLKCSTTNAKTKLEFGKNPATFSTLVELELELPWFWDLVLS
jgi:hypothetical protein